MSKLIKTRIYLDGESKYKKQLKEINSQLVDLTSKMNLATSTFKSNNTSLLGNIKNVKSLKEQQKVLTQQIETQKSKIETLKNAINESNKKYSDAKLKLKECTEQYGENSTEVQKAQKMVEKYKNQLENNTNALNNETANLNQMNAEFQENESTIKSLDPKMQVLKLTAEGLGTAFLGLSKVSLDALYNGVKNVGKALGTISTASIETITKTVEVSTEAFKKYTDAIADSLTAIGKYSVNTGMDFTSSLSNVQATLGYVDNTDEQVANMQLLEDTFKEIGATTQYTATEVSDGAQKMALASWDVNDIMAGIAPSLNLVSASGEDLVTVFDVLTDAITACGYTAQDAQKWVDVMSATITNSNTTVSDMGEALKYVGPLASNLNYSIEDLSLGLGLMANNGIKASMAGNSLKTGLSNMLNPTEDAQAVLDKYNISLKDSEGNLLSFEEVVQEMRTVFGGMSTDLVDASGEALEYDDLAEQFKNDEAQLQKLADAAELFGTRQVSSWLALANSTEADFNKLSDAIEDCDGMAEKMANVQLDNLTGDVTLLKSAVEGCGLSIYDYMEEPLRELSSTATTLFTNVRNNIENGFNFDGISQNIETFKNSVVSQFDTLFPELLQGLSGYTSTFNSAIYTLFSGFVDIAPKAIGQGGTVIVQSFWKLINDTISKVNSSKSTLTKTATTFVKAFANGLTSASNNLKSVLPSIISTLSNGVQDVMPTLINMGESILSTILTGITTALPEIANIGAEVLDYFSEELQNSPDIVTNLLEEVHNALVNSVPTILTSINSLVSTIFDSLSNDDVTIKITGLIRMVSDDLKNGLDEIVPEIVAFFPTFLNQLFQPLVDALLDADTINMLVDGVITMASELIDFIANNTEQLVDVIMKAITTLSDSLTANADTILPALAKFVEGIIVGIADNISDLLDSLLNLIDALVTVLCSPEVLNPLLEGVTTLISKLLFALIDNLPTLVQTITDVALAILEVFENPDILQQLIESTVELVADIILGLIELIPSLVISIKKFCESLYDSFKETILDNDWKEIGKQLLQGVADGLEDAWGYCLESIQSMAGRITESFKNTFEINSPSKLMRDEVGKYVSLGLADGITDEANSVSNSISSAVNAMTSDIDTTAIEIPAEVEVSLQDLDIADTQALNGLNDTINGMVDTMDVEVPTRLATATQDDLEVTTNKSNDNDVDSNSTDQNSTSQPTIVNFDGLFNGATVNINSGDDIESLAEKLYYYMQRQNMGVGIS